MDKIKIMPTGPNLVGYIAAVMTTCVGLITFGIAIFTPPISGPFCSNGCISYPFTDIISRYPRDYLWMYSAILFILIYVILIASIHQYASSGKKVFSQIALIIAAISTTILITDYFIQLTVIQPSLLHGEKDGISILTQYNPHGIFIALEEIGYLSMSCSFFFLAPVFNKSDRLNKTLRFIFLISFILAIVSLVTTAIIYGNNREYRFEVIIITLDWITLIVSGVLLGKIFKCNKIQTEKTIRS